MTSERPSHPISRVRGWLAKWQALLRLEDWEVRPVRVSEWDDGEVRAAEMRRCLEHMTAKLVLLTDASLRKWKEPRPLEKIVIHELLHLYFWTMDCDEYERVRNEQGINQLAYLLYEAHGDPE